jgi:hypothetical protein
MIEWALLGGVIGVMVAWSSDKKKEAARLKELDQWVDYGPTVEILGKTFTKQYQSYVCNGLVWGYNNLYGNYYGMMPAIVLSQSEFFKRLEAAE